MRDSAKLKTCGTFEDSYIQELATFHLRRKEISEKKFILYFYEISIFVKNLTHAMKSGLRGAFETRHALGIVTCFHL